MARKTSGPLDWEDLISDDGKYLGRFAIDRGLIVVESAAGWQKTTHASAGGSNRGLARLIRSEPPPIGSGR